jgi:integrase
MYGVSPACPQGSFLVKVSRKIKLTPLNIPTLPPGEHTDTVLRNLRLRVQPSGARSFCVVYRFNGRWRRFTLGTMPPLTLAEARHQGRQRLADVQKGVDPQAARVRDRQKSQTFAELVALYEGKHGTEMRRRSLAEFQRVCRVDILPAIGRLPPGPDMRPAIRALVERIIQRGARTQARRTLAAIKAVFNWSIAQDLIPLSANPTFMLPMPGEERPRDRVYSDVELRAIVSKVEGSELEDLVPFILFCATRSEETRGARWSEINRGERLWWVPAQRAKGGVAHPVCLSDGALAVLARIEERQGRHQDPGEFVFPEASPECPVCGMAGHMTDPQGAIQRVRRMSGVKDLRLHDLRRTTADRMQSELGVRSDVVSGVLGHKPPRLTRTYMPNWPLKEMRAAVEMWSSHVDRIVRGEGHAGQLLPFARP